jgi:hypothetical protein
MAEYKRERPLSKTELEKKAWIEQGEKWKRESARERRKDRLYELEWQVAQLRRHVEQDEIEREAEKE